MTDSTARNDLEDALAAEYTIVRETPQSAGFSAFSAKSKANGSNVEIKTVPSEIFRSIAPPGESDLAARQLRHPNILPILETGAHGGTFFWIAPEIDGRTLRARLSRGGRMEVNDSLTVLRDVSAALTHAHLHGVVHGGLSPDSVLISGGSALVSDLGIAEVFAALRRQSATPHGLAPTWAEPLRYVSPEQANDGKPDTRSDVYAWGVIAYELLGGRHPFAGRTTPRQMMAAHSDEEPAQLPPGPSPVPASITRLVMRCLSKDPARRPESARDILGAMTQEMLVPPPAPAAGTGQKAVIALLVLAVAAIGVIAWLGMQP